MILIKNFLLIQLKILYWINKIVLHNPIIIVNLIKKEKDYNGLIN